MGKDFNFPNWMDQEKLDEFVTTLRKAAMIPVNTIGRALNAPNVDLVEEKGKYVAFVEVPGFDRSEIELSVKDGVLTIAGNKPEDNAPCETDEKEYIIQERRCGGVFRRAINIPNPVKAEEISAKYNNGLLTIELPKTEREEGFKVNID
jgi:HSP20 family protein